MLKEAEEILKTNGIKADAPLLLRVSRALVLPEEVAITTEILAKYTNSPEAVLQVAKTIKAAALKYPSHDPLAVYVAKSSALHEVLLARTRELEKGSIVLNIINPEERSKTRVAMRSLVKQAVAIHRDPMVFALNKVNNGPEMARLKREVGEAEFERASSVFGASVGLARKEDFEIRAKRISGQMLQMEKYGISPELLGQTIHGIRGAVQMIVNKKSLPVFKEFRTKILSSKTAGSVLETLHLSGVNKILNIDKIVYEKVFKYIAETGAGKALEKGLGAIIGQVALKDLTTAGIGKIAGTKVIAFFAARGIPLPPIVSDIVSFIVVDVLEKAVGKTIGKITTAIKEGDYLTAASQISMLGMNLTINIVVETGKLFAKVSLVWMAWVAIAFIISFFFWSNYMSRITSLYLPPPQLNSFELSPSVNIVDMFDGKEPSKECPWGKPVNGIMTQGPGGIYSHRNANAVDIGARLGDTVTATHAGTVSFVGADSSGYGNLVKIDGICENPLTKQQVKFTTFLAHNSSFLVAEGSKVARGTPVARAGSTGNSTGVHVHYELRGLSNILNFIARNFFDELNRLGCALAGPFICSQER